VKPTVVISGQVMPEGDDSNGLLTESEIWFSYRDITQGNNAAVTLRRVLIQVHGDKGVCMSLPRC
jgi:hypothetical protein